MHKKTVIDFKELGVRQIFTHAIKEIKTKDIKEVKSLINQIEAYQEKGYFAVGYVPMKLLRPLNLNFKFLN